MVPPPRFSSCTLTNNALNLIWSAYPGKTYRVEYKTNLTDPAWTPLGANTLARAYTASVTDTNFPTPQRFYRVLQVN